MMHSLYLENSLGLVNAAYMLRIVVERTVEKQRDLYMCFFFRFRENACYGTARAVDEETSEIGSGCGGFESATRSLAVAALWLVSSLTSEQLEYVR